MTKLIRQAGVQVPWLSLTVIWSFGPMLVPLGARSPVATMLICLPSGVTLRMHPLSAVSYWNPRPPPFTLPPLAK